MDGGGLGRGGLGRGFLECGGLGRGGLGRGGLGRGGLGRGGLGRGGLGRGGLSRGGLDRGGLDRGGLGRGGLGHGGLGRVCCVACGWLTGDGEQHGDGGEGPGEALAAHEDGAELLREETHQAEQASLQHGTERWAAGGGRGGASFNSTPLKGPVCIFLKWRP